MKGIRTDSQIEIREIWSSKIALLISPTPPPIAIFSFDPQFKPAIKVLIQTEQLKGDSGIDLVRW